MAGFTGIYLAITHYRVEIDDLDELGVRLIIVNSFFVTSLSLLPVCLGAANFAPELNWRVSSVAYMLSALSVYVHLERRLRAIPEERQPQHMSLQNFLGRYSTIFLIIAQVPKIVGWPYDPPPFIIFIGIAVSHGLGAMAFSGFLFSRLR